MIKRSPCVKGGLKKRVPIKFGTRYLFEEQEAFVASFETLQDFIDWWNAAKEAEKNDEEIITGDPTIDLGELIPKN